MIVGFIGAGHITHALAEGWSRPGLEEAPKLRFFDVVAERATELAVITGGATAAGLDDLVGGSDLVVVAVRPEHVEGVLRQVANMLDRCPLVSVAAGVSLARVLASLPPRARAGRVMPNVAAALGLGVFLLVPGTLGSDLDAVKRLFSTAGDVVEVDEGLFDAATAVSGCMPGILAHLVRAFVDAGMEHDLPPDAALRLAVAGVHGAAALIAQAGDPAVVEAAASTPGGMTRAAIDALEEREIRAAVHAAVAAAAARARQLA